MKTWMRIIQYYIVLLITCFACKENTIPFEDDSDTLFTAIPSSHSNIDFKNSIKETVDFNFLNYSYIYNGGGVAVGDINNDGLEDIYFTSNQESNRLYLNKGNFVFEDITEDAGVKDDTGWSTGVAMVDINNDGWLDIYVCKSASLHNRALRQNKLFVNQKNNTFKEEALKYGLKEYSYSTQAYFLDYDKDGDLDMYLVNHSTDSNNKTLILNPQQHASLKTDSRDILFRNDNGKYSNVSKVSGISSLKAWGLSASIGDFNNDSWPDIFVANDFLEPDVLYINNQDGTFTNSALDTFKHISNNSMGSDFADVNNDLLPDLVVLDMLAADRKRGKENMASMDIDKFNRMVNRGYHYQYMSNMLQLNNGDSTFSEIGQLAGIAKTDWSWAPLIADYNNDGHNDIFITNGIEKDIANQDFRQTIANSGIINDKKRSFEKAKKIIPSAKLPNYMFINNADYTFKDKSFELGFDSKLNSNGAAYADLDNDGDLDLVISNQSDIASIYRNNTTGHYVSISLKGPDKNINGIGSKIKVYTQETDQMKEVYASRGYQSSVSHKLNFGLGNSERVDSIRIIWNDDKTQVLTNAKANKELILHYSESQNEPIEDNKRNKIFEKIPTLNLGITYKHQSVNYNDYDLQLLLPQKQSTVDNALDVGDVNGDGLDDFFVGNTMGYPASLYVQSVEGKFNETNQKLFEEDKTFNDNNARFFDTDNDGDLDLYVASGNYSLDVNSQLLQDRLYINDGRGNFSKGKLPKILSVTKAIAHGDYDNDGDLDLFIGGRIIPGKYPQAPDSYLLENRNGSFVNVTSNKAEELKNIGLVNDAAFSDYDVDGDVDLIVVGEWIPVTFFNNKNGVFTKVKMNTDAKSGWFQTIEVTDYDNDGYEDYFVGNYGENNKFHPTEDKPLHVYANYFDDNESYDIALTKESNGDLFPIRGKECSSQQTPFLNEKIGTYKEFANSNIIDVYGKDNIETALHLKATTFSSYFIKNNGRGNLEFKNLPMKAQFGPTLDFEFIDLDKNQELEVIGIGSIYDAEVETIRYDASNGYALTGNRTVLSEVRDLASISNNQAKAIESINIKGKRHLLILNANKGLSLIKINR